MEGPVTKGTAAGLMQGWVLKEMGGKTGTTQGNADAWFMGYTPQLLGGHMDWLRRPFYTH
jgi:penicillin-binding protein 1A